MHPYCHSTGVGVIPWSPLARGKLTRDWGTETDRSETDEFGKKLYRQTEESDGRIVDSVATVAAARGLSRAQVALAWVMHQAAVTAPIVGATREHHLADAVAAVDVRLDEGELGVLDEHYLPHAVEGF